jgi:curli production assembly/transport component CsgF
MRNNYLAVPALAALTLAVASTAAFGSELVYHPVSPTFGGSSLNGTFLLSQAQAQGEGVKSGAQSPDLSGLTNALSNLGSSGSGSSGSGSSGSGSSVPATSNAVRALVP